MAASISSNDAIKYYITGAEVEPISTAADKSIIGQLSEYIARARGIELPENVSIRARHHILDAIAAMISGPFDTPADRQAPKKRASSAVNC